jgi:hypothetical protein
VATKKAEEQKKAPKGRSKATTSRNTAKTAKRPTSRATKPKNNGKTTTFQKGNKIGNRFSSENQPENPGRKPSLLKSYIVDNGVSVQDVRLVLKNIILENTEADLKLIGADKSQPMIVRTVIKAYLHDFKNSSVYNLNSFLDRIYGCAAKEIKLPSRAGAGLTEPQIDAEIAAIEQELANDGK